MTGPPAQRVFLSHSTRDDEIVAKIRKHLEGLGVEVWADSRRLAPGDKLKPEVETAIEASDSVIAVLSQNAVNSPWVRLEIQLAQKAEKRIIPVLLDGIEPGALGLWFEVEPVALKMSTAAGGVADALPGLLAGLGERLSTDPEGRRPGACRPHGGPGAGAGRPRDPGVGRDAAGGGLRHLDLPAAGRVARGYEQTVPVYRAAGSD